MSDEYLRFPGGAVRKDDVSSVENRHGIGIHLALASVIATYALLAITLIFAFHAGDYLISELRSPDSKNESFISKAVVVVMVAVFWGIPLFLLGRGVDGFKTGDTKLLNTCSAGAMLTGALSGLVCITRFANPSGTDFDFDFFVAVLVLSMSLMVITAATNWNYISSHRRVRITLRNGQIINVDHIDGG